MFIKQSTQVPNVLIDVHVPHLTLAELKLLLVVIRQTNGWIDKITGKRKTRDWISHKQFVAKTGLTRQTVSSTLDLLSQKGLVQITDFNNIQLYTGADRRGKSRLYYAVNSLEDVGLVNMSCKVSHTGDVRLPVHNKTNSTKEKKTKGFKPIKDILKRLYRWK